MDNRNRTSEEQSGFDRRSLLKGAAAGAATAALPLIGVPPASAVGTGLVFVSHEKSHEVVVLDPVNYTEVKRIKTSRRPRGMAFNQAHTTLYVACGDEDVVDLIDVALLKRVGGIPTGPSPEVLALSPDEKLMFIANEEDSSMWIINTSDKVLQHEVPSGAEPEGVFVAPDGKSVYLTSEVADMIHWIDVATGNIIDNLVVGTRPRRVRMTPDRKELWITCELSGEVYIVDAATFKTMQVINFLPPGFRQVDVTPVGLELNKAGTQAYITLGRANHIAYVDVKTRKITDYVLAGSRPWGAALSNDQTKLFIANSLSDDITIIDVANKKTIKSVPTGRVPYIPLVDDFAGVSAFGN